MRALRHLLLSIGALMPIPATAAAQEPPLLRIVVIAGEDAVNVIQQKTAVAPIVEVRDRNDLPVAGVQVTFTIPEAATAAFADGARTMTVTTNPAGRAAATGLTTTRPGALRIEATASHQGQTATAVINQTAAAAPSSGGGAGAAGGGMGKTLAIVGGIAAAAGGVAVAAGARSDAGSDSNNPASTSSGPITSAAPPATTTPAPPANRPPVVDAVTASRRATIVGLPMSFTATASDPEGDALTYAWDFGDGSPTSTAAAPSHTYQRAGQFVVRLVVRDRESSAAAELPVVVNTLTGVWRTAGSASEDGTLTLTQTSPSSFSGTRLMILFGQRRDCPFTGTIAPTTPPISFSEGTCGGALPGRTFPLELSDDTNTLTGTVVVYVFQRQ